MSAGAIILKLIRPSPHVFKLRATSVRRLLLRSKILERDLICSGRLDAREAQRAIAEDWTAAYGRFFQPAISSAGGWSLDAENDRDSPNNIRHMPIRFRVGQWNLNLPYPPVTVRHRRLG